MAAEREMAKARNYVRPEVAALAGIHIPEPPGAIRLSHNENGLDFPDDLKAEVARRASARAWSRYPTFRPDRLAERIAAHVGAAPDEIVLANGSAETLVLAIAAAVGRGDHAVIAVPTYPRYRVLCDAYGATVHPVKLSEDDGFAFPVDKIIATARTAGARLVCANTPNNPTGSIAPVDALDRIATETDALLLVDAAYLEFSDQDLGALRERPNVIVTRSFSKSWSLAGLRIGYAVMHATLAEELHKLKLPFTPDVFSEEAALVALEHTDRFRARVADVARERDRLRDALNATDGFHAHPSAANFLLVRTTKPAADVAAALAAHGIIVANLNRSGLLPSHLRISVGTPAENDRLLATLRAG